MSRLYDDRPEQVSELILSDGRTAAYISREQRHFSTLQNGYPLTEEFLDELQNDGIDTIVIDTKDDIYVFSLQQYQRGNRLGHDPYPMKRVVSIEDAESPLNGRKNDTDD